MPDEEDAGPNLDFSGWRECECGCLTPVTPCPTCVRMQELPEATLPANFPSCIICEKKLKWCCPPTAQTTGNPDDAVCCFTSGQYGSRVLDLPGYQTEFVICDECLVDKSQRGFLIHYYRRFPNSPYKLLPIKLKAPND